MLAADTVVAVGRRILPKAETEAQARACLALLSGRRHRVLTRGGGARAGRAAGGAAGGERRSTFARLTDAQIARLSRRRRVAAARPAATPSRAGPRRIVRFLSGSYSGVVGLPLFETAQLLRGLGYPLP